MSVRRRLCIITPGQIGSNPRVVKEADTLHAAGYDVTVIATRTMEIVEARDRALMQRIPWTLQRVNLGSRLQWRARRVGQMAARGVFRLARTARLAGRAFSPYTGSLEDAALATQADLYIAHYPAALPAAAMAARKFGVRFAYDAEDFHLGQPPDDVAFDGERALLRMIEGTYLPQCAYVTAASPGIAESLHKAYGIAQPSVVLNLFPLNQAPRMPTARGTVSPSPSIYWFSQTIGPNRGVECAIEAIGIAETKPHLYLRGTPSENYPAELHALAARYGAEGRVHILPPDAPDEMVRLAVNYDLGLCSEPGHTENNRIALTNKLFTYLLAGVPPLMSAIPAQISFATTAGFEDLIYPQGDSAALAKLIDRLLGDGDRLQALRARVWSSAQHRWHWEAEEVRVIDAVRGTLGSLDKSERVSSEARS